MSQDSKKKRPDQLRTAETVAGERSAPDAVSKALRRASSSFGNQALQTDLDGRIASRDAMMETIRQRLESIRSVQRREVALSTPEAYAHWYRKLATGATETQRAKPDPTQWHEPAHGYERAARELARGSLQRAHQLLENALDSERRLFGALTPLVDPTDHAPPSTCSASPPAGGDVCPTSEVPLDIRLLLHDILQVDAHAKTPPWRRRFPDPWWTLDEDPEPEAPSDDE